jgi:hypothetical protein
MFDADGTTVVTVVVGVVICAALLLSAWFSMGMDQTSLHR